MVSPRWWVAGKHGKISWKKKKMTCPKYCIWTDKILHCDSSALAPKKKKKKLMVHSFDLSTIIPASFPREQKAVFPGTAVKYTGSDCPVQYKSYEIVRKSAVMILLLFGILSLHPLSIMSPWPQWSWSWYLFWPPNRSRHWISPSSGTSDFWQSFASLSPVTALLLAGGLNSSRRRVNLHGIFSCQVWMGLALVSLILGKRHPCSLIIAFHSQSSRNHP